MSQIGQNQTFAENRQATATGCSPPFEAGSPSGSYRL